MRVEHGLPVVSATINGHDLTFVVDTGAVACFLTTEAAERVAIVPSPGAWGVIWDGVGEKRKVPVAWVRRLTLDAGEGRTPVEAADVPFAIGGSPALAGKGWDGIVGLPVLSGAVARFDYAAGTLELRRGKLAADAPHTIRLERRDGLLFAPLSAVAGQARGREPAAALLDTGFYSMLMVDEDLGRSLGWAAPPHEWGRSKTLWTSRPARHARVSTDLSVGPVRLTRPVVNLADQGFPHQAILGSSFLRQFVWELDAAEGLMLVVDPPGEAISMRS